MFIFCFVRKLQMFVPSTVPFIQHAQTKEFEKEKTKKKQINYLTSLMGIVLAMAMYEYEYDIKMNMWRRN